MKRARPPSLIAALALLFVLPARAEDVGPPAPPDSRANPPPRDDGRRTGARFVANLGRNLVGVVSRHNLPPFIFGAWVAGTGSVLDDDVHNYFVRHGNEPFGQTGEFIGRPYVFFPVAGALFLSGRVSTKPRWRAATYDLAQAMMVNGAWTLALKYTTQRQRPDGSDKLSFPSGHASDAFAWATVGAEHYGWKLAVPAYLVAAAVGTSRLERDVHHFSDVLAGAALGVIVGRTVVRRNGELAPAQGPRVSFTPALDPHGEGRGLAVSIEF